MLLAESRGLSSRDAGLASQIVFGCLRFQGQLDFLIQHFSGRPAAALDLPVLVALRSAIFQLRHLDRIPAHAAVHDAVDYVKRRHRPASGFVNAVLRKVHREAIQWPDEATELSCPEWLLKRWKSHFGEATGRGIAVAALSEPEQYVRVAPGRPLPAQPALEATDIPGCYRLLSTAMPGMRLHDIGSQSVLPLLDLQPGKSYLDLCAAPGNKTVQALETALEPAVACDISLRRLLEVPPVCPRVVLDATRPLPFRCLFDRIFIDAPCSGTGTLARNPEIKWRVQVEDFGRFRDIQVQIVQQALRLLHPAGKLLYATCSLEPEENESVVAEVLQSQVARVVEHRWRLPGKMPGDGFSSVLFERAAP